MHSCPVSDTISPCNFDRWQLVAKQRIQTSIPKDWARTRLLFLFQQSWNQTPSEYRSPLKTRHRVVMWYKEFAIVSVPFWDLKIYWSEFLMDNSICPVSNNFRSLAIWRMQNSSHGSYGVIDQRSDDLSKDMGWLRIILHGIPACRLNKLFRWISVDLISSSWCSWRTREGPGGSNTTGRFRLKSTRLNHRERTW